MQSKLCVAALLAWIVTMGVLGWLFVKGWTVAGTGGRVEIVLAPAERDQILAEMRQLLKSVHGVVTGLSGSDGDVKAAEEAARAAGMTMAADVNPALMAKLPLAFNEMGMSVYQDMDLLADAVVQRETPPQILRRLSSITARCTTCHDMFQLVSSK
jgi:cytochrome c556